MYQHGNEKHEVIHNSEAEIWSAKCHMHCSYYTF